MSKMNPSISQVNLTKYLPFFASLTNKGHALVVCNYLGKPLLSELSDELLQQTSLTMQEITKLIDWDEVTKTKGYLHIDKVGHIFFSPLILGANENSYWLVGFHKTELAISQQQIDSQCSQFQHIASCLTEDFNQTETVTGMADELSVRYEELNLLYGMDDIESFYKNNDEEKSLKQIAQNCVDYLNIDYSAIYIPEHDFFFHQLSSTASLANGSYLEQIIRQHLFSYITSKPETLVINRDNEIDWTDADLHIPNKLIAAPIFLANQNPCGLLVLINSLDSLDFSNSDRKLTEVLASEASKLIQARRDPTTGQLNRRGFTERLEKALAERELDVNDCLLVIDLDQFKVVNDSAGQKGGDQLLRQITGLILKNLKKSDVLSRLGSDEFAIILKQCSLENATEIAERIRLVIKQFRFLYQEKMFDLSACLGVVELNVEIKDFSQALGAADLACSVAKEQGRNRVHIYKSSDELLLKHENEMQWIGRINQAIEEDLFQIYRQKIQLLDGDPAREEHYEILIRLKERNGEVLSPFHFIPAAERFNLMPKIDRWVIKTTLKRMAEAFVKYPDSKLVCSINLSGQSFSEEGFVGYIKEQINKFTIPANRICLEMTETAAVSNLTQAVKFMEEMKAFGCHFSLDDFGSGMSSFTYLKNLPVDYLKIDGYFVKTMMENNIDKAMVNAIHQIGTVMGLKTIAEFVENDEIMNELKKMGIDYGQGYGIHKPEHFV
jgi:diguanylate cyclase (GGDEF)-like protein